MTISDASRQLVAALKERGITDERVLDAIARVPRELFVDPAHAEMAYCDQALPIACGQTISQPYVVAYMTEKLAVGPEDEVLEIGTGSGYQAAVLAGLARHVFTMERHKALLAGALLRFRAMGLRNVTAIVGDGAQGWPEPRRFDRIIVTAGAKDLPEALLAQLETGGRLIMPLGGRLFGQRLVLFHKTEDGVERTNLLPVRFVPLVEGQG